MADIFPFIDETLDWCTHYVNRIETLRLMEAAAPPGNQQREYRLIFENLRAFFPGRMVHDEK